MKCGTVDPVTSGFWRQVLVHINTGELPIYNDMGPATRSQDAEFDIESSFSWPTLHPPHANWIEHETALRQLRSRKCVSFDS